MPLPLVVLPTSLFIRDIEVWCCIFAYLDHTDLMALTRSGSGFGEIVNMYFSRINNIGKHAIEHNHFRQFLSKLALPLNAPLPYFIQKEEGSEEPVLIR